MKRIVAALLLILCFVATAVAAPSADTGVVAIVNATLIDGNGGPAQKDLTILIEGDRISHIGKSAELKVPANAQVVDGTGKFLIPGLWDMHVHWYLQDYLPLFIANGVTGIRVMWGYPVHHQWRKAIEENSLTGPRMSIASPIVDGPKPLWPASITVGNETEAREVVRKAKQDGADFVKVYTLLPREAYFAIADESKKLGIAFDGHVPMTVSMREASAAGQRTVEHLYGILNACSTREEELLKAAQALAAEINEAKEPVTDVAVKVRRPSLISLETYSSAKAEGLFAELKKNGTWQCPTLVVLRNMSSMNDPGLAADPRMKYMPARIKPSWDPANDARLKTRTSQDYDLSKQSYRKGLEVVGAMQRAGVGIIAGTDTGNPYCFPGFSLHDELMLLVQAGLSPMEALQAATRNAAQALGREKELGTVEPGKKADLVLLEANPLEDIGNTRKINAVVLGGRLFSEKALKDMLGKIETLTAKVPAAQVLFKTAQEKDIDAAIKQYREMKASSSADLSERTLNRVGYLLLGANKTKDAIKILELNVEAYPKSSNVYDSLAEAYLKDGNKELAIRNYEKSLALDPANKGARETLERIKGRPEP